MSSNKIFLELVEFYEAVKKGGGAWPYISRMKWGAAPDEVFEHLKEKGILVTEKADKATLLSPPRSSLPQFRTFELTLEDVTEERRGILTHFSIDEEYIYTQRMRSHYTAHHYADFLPGSLREAVLRGTTPVIIHSMGHRKLGNVDIECVCEHVYQHFLHYGDRFFAETIPIIKER